MAKVFEPNEEQKLLYRVHCARIRAHWGKKADVDKNWPKTREEWVAVEHGSPCDTNVVMAKFHLQLYRSMQKEGII